nr:helicase-related protein [Kineosporia babensis]
MHLLKEELGAFSGHYEGLIAELQRGGPSGLPSKILAASATIVQYEDQLRQVYGRRPRAFPSQGFKLGETFYVETTRNIRRVFLGVLPNYRRKADVAATVQTELARAITLLEDDPGRLAELQIPPDDWEGLPTDADVDKLLFDYEVSLGYVNSKTHGAKLDEELSFLSSALTSEGHGQLSTQVLTGQVPIPDLADAIERVEEDSLVTPRPDRLRALVGTSVVSHGVDLDRLNNLVMAGMPTTAADYIQVTARSGRTHVGLVATVYDGNAARERSLFSNFMSFHSFLDQMVTPVPVNKYAFFVADRTLPGIALALFHDMARRAAHHAPVEGVRQARDFQKWWNTYRASIDAEILQRLPLCYSMGISGVNDPGMEKELVERAVARWEQTERNTITAPAEVSKTVELFKHLPLRNFRSIDEASGFTTVIGSRDAFNALTGRATDDEDV